MIGLLSGPASPERPWTQNCTGKARGAGGVITKGLFLEPGALSKIAGQS
jgi:hypothetical protein